MHAVEWRKREVTLFICLSFFTIYYIISNGQSFFRPHVNDISNRRASYWKWQFILTLEVPNPKCYRLKSMTFIIPKNNVIFPYYLATKNVSAWLGMKKWNSNNLPFAHFILVTNIGLGICLMLAWQFFSDCEVTSSTIDKRLKIYKESQK